MLTHPHPHPHPHTHTHLLHSQTLFDAHTRTMTQARTLGDSNTFQNMVSLLGENKTFAMEMQKNSATLLAFAKRKRQISFYRIRTEGEEVDSVLGSCPGSVSLRGIAMDKALACHTGSRGSNSDMTKVYSAPILSGTPPCSLSLTMPVVTCLSVNTCHMGGKKRGKMVKS